MSLAPSSSVGKVRLQPSYFTSSCYVLPLKSDIDALVKTFEGEYTESEEKNKPFTLFKTVWCAMGWQWMQFKVFDPRARDMFFQVTCQLFIERSVSQDQTPVARLVALFALYTFLNTQPSGAPALHAIDHLSIPRDHYNTLLSVSDTLEPPLRAAAINITRLLVNANIFHIIPDSDFGTQYPRALPREVLVLDTAETAADAPKKKGRPSKADRLQKAQIAVDDLNRWLQRTGTEASSETTHKLLLEDPNEMLEQYRDYKTNLLDSLAEDPNGISVLTEANKQVYYRLQTAAELNGTGETASENQDGPGIPRVERAIVQSDSATGGPRGGLLGLLEGAGNQRSSLPGGD